MCRNWVLSCDFLGISYQYQNAILLENYEHIENSSKSVIRFTPSWWYKKILWPITSMIFLSKKIVRSDNQNVFWTGYWQVYRTIWTLSGLAIDMCKNIWRTHFIFFFFFFLCVEVLRPSQFSGVLSSAVNLPNHTFSRQAQSSRWLTVLCTFFQQKLRIPLDR